MQREIRFLNGGNGIILQSPKREEREGMQSILL